MVNNELTHYGILGMKWGVRRTEAQLARARGKSNIDVDDVDEINGMHDDYKKAHRFGRVSYMSDAELKARINRLQMEDQYTKLTAVQKSAGRKFVEDVLTNAAKQTATKYVSKGMDKAVEKMLKKSVK